ncbi:MAG: energy transducer TonB [Acidobacteria bacterium]|nr:energy transducer TonB [Acidobacteriota bacterium]
MLINEEGKIVTARVVQGHPLFDETMLRALCRWEFRPFYHEGKPVSVWGTVREVFTYPKAKGSS